jgi:hypothetical protein
MTKMNKAKPTHTFKRGQHGDAFCMVKHAGFVCGRAADDAVHATESWC